MNKVDMENKLKELDQQFTVDTKDLNIRSDRWLGLYKHYCSVKWEILRDNGKT